MPRFRHTPLLIAPLLLAAGARAQQILPSSESIDKHLPAVSLLPEGSTLQGVMLPRYDEKQRLLAVLRAEHMLIIDSETVDATKVRIDLHQAEGGHRGSIELAKARFDQAKRLLRASDDVQISSKDMSAHGTGLVFSLENGRGFLLGPVATRFYPAAPATSMNAPFHTSPPATTTRWTAALGTALCLPLIAAPAPLTDQETATIDRKSAPATPVAERHARATEKLTEATNRQVESTEQNITDFLRAASLTSLLADAAAIETPALEAPKIEAKPGDTQVDCDGGMYFDTEDGVLVYLDNIRLTDPRFELTCKKELKIFLERKEKKEPEAGAGNSPPEEPKPDTDKPTPAQPEPATEKEDPKKNDSTDPADDDLFSGAGFGEIKQIVATGGVKAVRKDAKGNAVTATGETAIFDAQTGDVILRGGYPTIRQGGSSLAAQEPGLYIRLYQNGDIYAQPGRWKTIADKLDAKKPGTN